MRTRGLSSPQLFLLRHHWRVLQSEHLLMHALLHLLHGMLHLLLHGLLHLLHLLLDLLLYLLLHLRI